MFLGLFFTGCFLAIMAIAAIMGYGKGDDDDPQDGAAEED